MFTEKVREMVKDKFEKGLINRGPNRKRSYFTGLVIATALLFSYAAKAELILNGSTIYSDLGKDQFVAALYTETTHNSPQVVQTLDSEKRMEVRMLNDYSKRRWINLWMQSISINNSRENFSDSAKELIALMQAAKSAPKKGDVLEYLFSPQNGTSMRFNGTELISDLSGEVFGLLLRTWVGAIPPSTSFKEELLGNQRNSQAHDLLESLTPDKQRIALAASWILPAPAKKVAKPAAPKIAAAPVKTKPAAKVKAIPVPELELDSELPLVETAEIKEQPVKPAPSKQAKTAEPEKPSAGKDIDTTKVAATETSAEESEEDIDFNVSEALAQRDYTPLVVQKIYQNISYPSRAVSKNQQGTVRVAVKIGRSGELQSALTTQESRHSSLNKAALKAVEKAAPFPTLPEQITADSFELSIPITFRLQ
jgi:protein TonB